MAGTSSVERRRPATSGPGRALGRIEGSGRSRGAGGATICSPGRRASSAKPSGRGGTSSRNSTAASPGADQPGQAVHVVGVTSSGIAANTETAGS